MGKCEMANGYRLIRRSERVKSSELFAAENGKSGIGLQQEKKKSGRSLWPFSKFQKVFAFS